MPSRPAVHSLATGAPRHDDEVTEARRRQGRRQYRTNSKEWRAIREQQLRRQPLCEDCLDEGRTEAADTVDHRDGNSWNNATSNLRSLCRSCHSSKTARHDGGFGNRIDRKE